MFEEFPLHTGPADKTSSKHKISIRHREMIGMGVAGGSSAASFSLRNRLIYDIVKLCGKVKVMIEMAENKGQI